MSCHDCGCKEGELHNFFPNCDMERCTQCQGQLLSCGCEPSENIREPYFERCFCCERCGEKFPQMKMLSKEEWKYICGVTYPLDCVLCIKCMDFIKKMRDKNGQGNK